MNSQSKKLDILKQDIERILYPGERLEIEPDPDQEGKMIFWIIGLNDGVEYRAGLALEEAILREGIAKNSIRNYLISYFWHELANFRPVE